MLAAVVTVEATFDDMVDLIDSVAAAFVVGEEQLALMVKCHAVGVAQSAGDFFKLFAIG